MTECRPSPPPSPGPGPAPVPESPTGPCPPLVVMSAFVSIPRGMFCSEAPVRARGHTCTTYPPANLQRIGAGAPSPVHRDTVCVCEPRFFTNPNSPAPNSPRNTLRDIHRPLEDVHARLSCLPSRPPHPSLDPENEVPVGGGEVVTPAADVPPWCRDEWECCQCKRDGIRDVDRVCPMPVCGHCRCQRCVATWRVWRRDGYV